MKKYILRDELGGWIEEENNVDQSGRAWVPCAWVGCPCPVKSNSHLACKYTAHQLKPTCSYGCCQSCECGYSYGGTHNIHQLKFSPMTNTTWVGCPAKSNSYFACKYTAHQLKFNPMTNPPSESVEKAIQEWERQGRSEEARYGVRNFFTGRGIKLVEEIYQSGVNDTIEKLVR